MRVLDLFSGIGGFSLGLERAGMRTVAFCEIDPFCRRVLAHHWPDVRIYHSIRRLKRPPAADVVCGGFPCQDISVAGKGAGLAGARSGLWSELARVIGLVRPSYAVVENVSALLGRGLGTVLRDLAAIGYDAEWHCIPASAIGAPHQRDRIWIIAYPGGSGFRRLFQSFGESRSGATAHIRGDGEAWPLADADEIGREPRQRNLPARESDADWRGADVADPDDSRPQGWLSEGVRERSGERVAGPSGSSVQDTADDASHSQGIRRGVGVGEWRVEPDVGRVADGVPSRVDRLKALGNAVVPQIPEIIGRAIMRAAVNGDVGRTK